MSLPQNFPGFSLVHKKQKSDIEASQIVTFETYICDSILQQYQDLNSDNFKKIKLINVSIYEKQFDDPLPWYKSFIAKVIKIPKIHSFIYIEAQNSIFITIDFYQGGRVVQRIGKTKQDVLNAGESSKRLFSKQSINSIFNIRHLQCNKKISIYQIGQIKQKSANNQQYNQVSNNCHRFCQRFMEFFQNLSKNQN